MPTVGKPLGRILRLKLILISRSKTSPWAGGNPTRHRIYSTGCQGAQCHVRKLTLLYVYHIAMPLLGILLALNHQYLSDSDVVIRTLHVRPGTLKGEEHNKKQHVHLQSLEDLDTLQFYG